MKRSTSRRRLDGHLARLLAIGFWLIPRLELLGAWVAFTVGQVALATGFAIVLWSNAKGWQRD